MCTYGGNIWTLSARVPIHHLWRHVRRREGVRRSVMNIFILFLIVVISYNIFVFVYSFFYCKLFSSLLLIHSAVWSAFLSNVSGVRTSLDWLPDQRIFAFLSKFSFSNKFKSLLLWFLTIMLPYIRARSKATIHFSYTRRQRERKSRYERDTLWLQR